MTREEFLALLRASAEAGEPIIGAGAGTGLVAKAAAHGGADFIAIYCTSKARHKGLPTSIIGDPNTITIELLGEVAAVVHETPLVAGVHATDPTRRMEDLLEIYRGLGCSGVINYPSMGLYGREYVGGPVTYEEGLEIEAECLRMARAADLVAMTYVYRPSEAAYLAPVADVIVAHAGWTAGGMVGAPHTLSFEEAAAALNEQVQAARQSGGTAIYLGHGGPFSGPEDTKKLYELTEVAGFVGASSIERIPVETAVSETVRHFKSIPLGAAAVAPTTDRGA